MGVVLALAILSGCGEPDQSILRDSPELQGPPAPQMRRGLWVLAEGSERVLEHPDRVSRLIENAQEMGATDLFVQVYRQGRSWYASTHADAGPWERIGRSGEDDPLRTLIARSHAGGLRVHAWFNALSVHRNRKAPVLQKVGRAAVMVDKRGENLLDYPNFDVPPPLHKHVRMGTPGIWLDPVTPGVIEVLEGALDDLIAAAPELDGLHLDFIRHPLALPIMPGSRFDRGLDFGYGRDAKLLFAKQNGGRFQRGDAWDAFRRNSVTQVVERLGKRLPDGWEYSAAVLPWADRAYMIAMQDWRGWIDSGLLDFAVVMAYIRDDRLLRYVIEGLRHGVGGDRVWVGLGTWLFLRHPDRIRAQTEIALGVDPAGVAFFSYDALANEPEAAAALRPAEPDESL